MGIDLYARQTSNSTAWKHTRAGYVLHHESEDSGYLREAYFSGIYAIPTLAPEAFGSPQRVQIPAAKLRERLPQVLEVTEWRESRLLGRPKAEVRSALREIRKFVKTCERIERQSGKPATTQVSW
jgi:hypothetical protein